MKAIRKADARPITARAPDRPRLKVRRMSQNFAQRQHRAAIRRAAGLLDLSFLTGESGNIELRRLPVPILRPKTRRLNGRSGRFRVAAQEPDIVNRIRH